MEGIALPEPAVMKQAAMAVMFLTQTQLSKKFLLNWILWLLEFHLTFEIAAQTLLWSVFSASSSSKHTEQQVERGVSMCCSFLLSSFIESNLLCGFVVVLPLI